LLSHRRRIVGGDGIEQRRDTGEPNMDEQDRADLAEAEAIARYLAMRAAWGPCWGRRPR
jgi:hypothetical protein